eukprot:7262768-Pyramimonas_sp.AAC.1
MPPREPQEDLKGPRVCPRGPQDVPKGTQNGPRGAQDRQRGPQDGPKRGSTNHQVEPSAPRGPPEAPRGPQESSGGPLKALRGPQEAQTEAPRGPQTAPTRLQEATDAPANACDGTIRATRMSEAIKPSLRALRRPLQRFMSTDGTAPLEDNRLKTLKHAKTLFSGFYCHGSTRLLRLGDPESCQNAVLGTSTPRSNVITAPSQSRILPKLA